MICNVCGFDNQQDARHCVSCGAVLVTEASAGTGGQTQGSGAPAAGQAPAGAYSQQPTAGGYGQQAPMGANGQPQPEQQGYGAGPGSPYQGGPEGAPPSPPVQYEKGCAGSAWSDVCKTKGWFAKALFLGLLQSVPILNWVVSGYSMAWAKDAAQGRFEPMPKKVFLDGAFSMGFYWFVFSLVAAIAVYVGFTMIDVVLALIPVVGPMLVVAVSLGIGLFIYPFELLCGMRIAISGNLGPAFRLDRSWDAFTRRLGSVWCASELPQLIIVTICYAIAFGIALALASGFIGVLIGLVSTPYPGDIYLSDAYYDMYFDSLWYDQGLATAFTGSLLLALLGLGLAYYVINVGTALATVVSYRAVGYYIGRYCPEWDQDPTLHPNAYLGGAAPMGGVPPYGPQSGYAGAPADQYGNGYQGGYGAGNGYQGGYGQGAGYASGPGGAPVGGPVPGQVQYGQPAPGQVQPGQPAPEAQVAAQPVAVEQAVEVVEVVDVEDPVSEAPAASEARAVETAGDLVTAEKAAVEVEETVAKGGEQDESPDGTVVAVEVDETVGAAADDGEAAGQGAAQAAKAAADIAARAAESDGE